MRILFGSPSPYFPQHFGGIEANMDHLCRGLVAKGHEITLLTGLASGDLVWMRNRLMNHLFGIERSGENFHGYRLVREWNIPEAAEQLVKAFAPDVLVGHGGAAIDVLFTRNTTRIPTVAHLHGMPPLERAQALYQKGVRNYVCCSHFVKARFLERVSGGEPTHTSVIYNAFDPSLYKAGRDGKFVTMIDPISQKGIEIAFALASALPEVPFLFVKAWRIAPDKFAPIQQRLRAMHNVTLRESVLDMRSIYKDTRILIVPSQVEEGGPRVITEAQLNGIPVIGSDRGGIPEIIGSGGIVLPHDKAELWVRSLREVWETPALWEDLSLKGRLQVESGAFSYHKIVGEYECFLRRCISSRIP
jgi:glycosyltransferase involved in cell wall biosynthesis